MALTVEQIIKALKKNAGFVSTTAEALNVTPHAIYKRIRESEKIKQALKEIEEKHLDFAESRLLSKIKKDDLGAICFYLKCKGKDRGYIEKAQLEHSTEENKSLGIRFIKSSGE